MARSSPDMAEREHCSGAKRIDICLCDLLSVRGLASRGRDKVFTSKEHTQLFGHECQAMPDVLNPAHNDLIGTGLDTDPSMLQS
jgi:hypothetical protein